MVDFLEKMIAFGHIASSFSNRVIRIHRNFPREPSRTLKPGIDRAQSSQNPLNRSGASPQRFGQRIPDRPWHPQPPRALSSSLMYRFCFVLNRDLVHLNFSEVHRPPSTYSVHLYSFRSAGTSNSTMFQTAAICLPSLVWYFGSVYPQKSQHPCGLTCWISPVKAPLRA